MRSPACLLAHPQLFFGTLIGTAFLITVTLPSSNASGQVLQLPTYRTFGAGTTIWVPDRGVVEFGRISRGRMGVTSRGVPGLSHLPGVGPLFTSRGVGISLGTTSTSATVTVLDLEAMDREVLQEGARIRESRRRAEQAQAQQTGLPVLSDSERKKAKFLSRNVGRTPK